jgi:SRSO17 transposase
MAYLRARLRPAARTNPWPLAESCGEANPYGWQHLVGRAEWDAAGGRDDLRGYVLRHLADEQAALVLAATSFPKQGTKSVGVARQSGGSLGTQETCQVGVLLADASPSGHAATPS